MIYSPKLIKLGYEIETYIFFQEEKQNVKMCFYTIEDDQNKNNENSLKFEFFPSLEKAKGNFTEINIDNIPIFMTRIYNYSPLGLEFFLINGKTFYFVFKKIVI